MSLQKKNILIIEDSLAIASLIQDFLKKLNYQNIEICNTGRSGIQIFEELVKSNKIPVVILDYSLPDMNGDDIMSEIFRIRPDTKIIIETANERTDDSIKNVLRHGAYQFIGKPIRFENIKSTMAILEEEDKILENTPIDDHKEVDALLRSSTRISVARISEYAGKKREDVLEYLKNLTNEGKSVPVENIKEISCNMCDSVKIEQNFSCPSCNKTNFKQGKLIEHFKCGNVSIEDSYKNDICPKCHKEIKIIGVDYKTIDNYYVCSDCGEKFPEPIIEYVCIRCNNKFKLEQAKWITSEGFRSTNL
ncbi:MAG: response regulator [Thaumarchaeota archaeon]|nr:response regulator [Nitrososphaerota archaeon]MBI3641168.1 response regulator [Nitrososphaerota archaeon]